MVSRQSKLWGGFPRSYWLDLARCYWNLGIRDSFRGCLAKAKAAPDVRGFGFESWARRAA